MSGCGVGADVDPALDADLGFGLAGDFGGFRDFGMAAPLTSGACHRKRLARKAYDFGSFFGSARQSVALQLGRRRLYSAHISGARCGGWRRPQAAATRGSMFITPAYAQFGSLFGGGAGGGDNMLVSLLPFILIFVIMYFLILRPQQKRVKQHQEMVKNVRRGDTVVTSGGLVGKVTKVIDDDQVEVEIADDVRVRQMRSMLSEVRAKGEPVKEESTVG